MIHCFIIKSNTGLHINKRCKNHNLLLEKISLKLNEIEKKTKINTESLWDESVKVPDQKRQANIL